MNRLLFKYYRWKYLRLKKKRLRHGNTKNLIMKIVKYYNKMQKYKKEKQDEI